MEYVDKRLSIERLSDKTGLRKDTIEIVIDALEQDIKEFFEASDGLRVYQIGFILLSNERMSGYNKELRAFYN